MNKILNILLSFLLITFLTKAQSSFLAEQGVAVFCPADMDSVRTLPSLALVKNLQPQGSVPDNWKTRPVFSKINGKSAVTITFDEHVVKRAVYRYIVFRVFLPVQSGIFSKKIPTRIH